MMTIDAMRCPYKRAYQIITAGTGVQENRETLYEQMKRYW
jgi:hypothetical protein